MSTGKQGKSGLGIEAQRDRDRLLLRQNAAQVVYMTGPLDIFRRMLGRLVSSGIQYLGQVNVRAVNVTESEKMRRATIGKHLIL
jgi:hypothetical protein